MIMKAYKLWDTDYRKNVDLRDFKKDITDTVAGINPELQVIVNKDHYMISEDAKKGEIIAIGRALAKTKLGQYSVPRTVLFFGQTIEIPEDDEEENINSN